MKENNAAVAAGTSGLGKELEMIRDQFRHYASGVGGDDYQITDNKT